jgi:hypothetical protein
LLIARIIHGHRGSADICAFVDVSVILTLFFYDCGQKAPLPPLTDRVVMDSGGGTKDVGTFGDQLIEVPAGPVAGGFDDHPASEVIWPAERSTISSREGRKSKSSG